MDLRLLGQSNASIQIIQEHHMPSRVRKSVVAKSKDVHRFEQQFKKHQQASDELLSPLRYPKVVSNLKDGAYEMEYVPGITLGQFLLVASKQESETVTRQIQDFLEKILNLSSAGNHAQALRKKVDDLISNSSREFSHLDIFCRLSETIVNTADDVMSLEGWNHGDLSFENILIVERGKKVYVLDFLDSPFESPLIDIGRLSLDSKFGWWAAQVRRPANYQLNLNTLDRGIQEALGGVRVDERTRMLYIGLAVLRILPYTNNPSRLAFLKYAAAIIERELK